MAGPSAVRSEALGPEAWPTCLSRAPCSCAPSWRFAPRLPWRGCR